MAFQGILITDFWLWLGHICVVGSVFDEMFVITSIIDVDFQCFVASAGGWGGGGF